MDYNSLNIFVGKHIIIFGIDKNGTSLVKYIKYQHLDIHVDFMMEIDTYCELCLGLPVLTVAQAQEKNKLNGAIILIAHESPMVALNQLLSDSPAEIWLVSRQLHSVFGSSPEDSCKIQAQREVTPFYLERGTPKIQALITNAYTVGVNGNNVLEIADFDKQEYTTWSMPTPNCPLSLKEFSTIIPQDALPMRMSHLSYLLWERGIHVTQLSPSRKWLVGVRYNYFFIDILNTETGELVRWHDLPPEQGLWSYVATGDFDNDKDEFLFVRWPMKDVIKGMRDGTNRVHCQVCRLNLNTMQASVMHEFDFQDRIHQCTISGDGRYMVFAPMRVLRPTGDPKKLSQQDIMTNLQKNVVLDSMATLDLQTGKVWFTQIPYPIPAHFELDPLDPHVFYVSTHSLMPYADGVLCFQPGTLHKMRILDGKTVVEGTYTHPGFIRTTQHCVFAWDGKVYIAATNQNKLEIIDAASMQLWHCHRICDDPYYDTADFTNADFLKKPFVLPPQPAWCDSVAASGDGKNLIMHLTDHYSIFDMESKSCVGNVKYRDTSRPSSHSRYWMQNSPDSFIHAQYKKLATLRGV